jgi:hypothetical protein
VPAPPPPAAAPCGTASGSTSARSARA